MTKGTAGSRAQPQGRRAAEAHRRKGRGVTRPHFSRLRVHSGLSNQQGFLWVRAKPSVTGSHWLTVKSIQFQSLPSPVP